MAILCIPVLGRTITVRRHPYFREDEVHGKVPSLKLGQLRISWWPKSYEGRAGRQDRYRGSAAADLTLEDGWWAILGLNQ